MRFESSITLLKHLVIKGTILSLMGLSGVVAADTYTVSSGADDGGDGTLRTQVNSANQNAGSAILFSNGLPDNTTIPISSALPILKDMRIDAVTAPPTGLRVGSGLANPLFTISPGATLTLDGKTTNDVDNSLTWFGSIANNGTLALRQAENTVYRGAITGTGAVTFEALVPDTSLTLSASNTYTGGTTIISGIVTVGANNALPSVGPVTVNAGATLNIPSDIGNDAPNGRSQTLESLSGGGMITMGSNNPSLTLNPNTNSTFSGVMSSTNTGASVTKTGAGTQTLSGQNTSTGTLTINGGAIELAGGSWAGPIAVNANGTLLITNATGGAGNDVANTGTLTNLDTANAFNIGGYFTQNGIMNIAIAAAGQNSRFTVTGDTTLNASTLNVTLPNSGVINDGAVFTIVDKVQGVPVLPTVNPPSSLFISFTPAVVANELRLTAHRELYADVNAISVFDPLAKALDTLATNNHFDPVLSNLDHTTTLDEYKDKLTELAPIGLDGLYMAAAEGADGGAEQAFLRLDTARAMGTTGALARTGYIRTGYAAGDMLENQGSYGPIVFGNSTKQDTRNGLRGYNATTAGFGFLGDVPILEYFRVGLGITYASSAVKQSDNTGSNTKIGSTQGLAYGSATYGPLFFDGVLSAGVNNYHGKRNMPSFGQTATSTYNGFQYSAKAKAGFTIPCDQIEISPTAGVQYMHLNVGKYTEKGAGILNESPSAIQTSSVRVSLGARLADRSQEEDFFPEIHAFYLVDVKNPNVLITSRFVAGGGTFVSTSALPPKAGINVGASITALVSDGFVLSGGYDLEAKKSFRSHSASLKFKFLF